MMKQHIISSYTLTPSVIFLGKCHLPRGGRLQSSRLKKAEWRAFVRKPTDTKQSGNEIAPDIEISKICL